MDDTKRAALILAFQNGLAMAVAFGLDLTADQTAGVLTFANSALTLAMLFWKQGQARGPGGDPNLPAVKQPRQRPRTP